MSGEIRTHDVDKRKIMFIRAGGGFIREGLCQEGYRVERPFKEKGILLRVLREACFRLKLPGRSLFYNKEVLAFHGTHILIYDPQITQEYLLWLQKHHKDKKLLFYYGNMIGHARHIIPNMIPKGISVWTYEDSDSKKYGINLNKAISYFRSFCCEKQEPEYDLLFVGRDKGRIEFLCKLEEALQEAGLKTFFRIVGDTRFEKKKDKRYGAEMAYDEICKLIARSKAILNVVLPGQEGTTIRDYEAICNDVKLITTNSAITALPFYNPANIFVIEKIDADQIKAFLDVPMEPYSDSLKNSLTTENWLQVMM